jgi:hypothetical protein
VNLASEYQCNEILPLLYYSLKNQKKSLKCVCCASSMILTKKILTKNYKFPLQCDTGIFLVLLGSLKLLGKPNGPADNFRQNGLQKTSNFEILTLGRQLLSELTFPHIVVICGSGFSTLIWDWDQE